MDINDRIEELGKSLKEVEGKLAKDLNVENFKEVKIDKIYEDDEIQAEQAEN